MFICGYLCYYHVLVKERIYEFINKFKYQQLL